MSYWFDPVFLSRIQFAFVVCFHIIFPALTIGLSSWLVVLELLHLKTKHPVYMEIYNQWVKVFAVSFGMGVVSGIVMSYQFGTNWSEFSRIVGDVVGPIMAFEVLTAFFLEASFLGVMLFGQGRVSPKMHFFATSMVAIGTIISAFWILSVNSWMHTPTGFAVEGDILVPTSWLSIIFNPSFPYRFFHMIIGAYLTTAFFVAGVASYYKFRRKNIPHAKVMFSMAMLIAVFVTPLQIIIGHEHGVNTLEYQPVKIAAMEGIYHTEIGADLNLIGIPNDETQTVDYAIKIPKMASLVLTGDKNSKVLGLSEWKEQDRPPVLPVFLAFRLMVGIGMLMQLSGIIAIILFLRKKLFDNNYFHIFSISLMPSGFIAILAGWVTTEVGRQPWTVYEVLRTANSGSPISPEEVLLSLISFVFVYSIVFTAGVYYIVKLLRQGPNKGDWHDAYGTHGLDHPANLGDVFLGINKRN